MMLQTSAQHHQAVAQEIQLMLEYNPAPPFTSGSPTTAAPELLERVKAARRPVKAACRAIAEHAAARLRQR